MTLNSEAQVSPMADDNGLTQKILDALNTPQESAKNRETLAQLGGIDGLFSIVGVDPRFGLTHDQVRSQRIRFGDNTFPESPMESYFSLLFNALSDTTLLILAAAALVSLVIGVITEPDHGYIEGAAIFIAIFLVSNISAGNDYSKQLQFKALETSSAKDERTSILREGAIERINPKDLVVGDILVLQAGDAIPADCIIFSKDVVLCNESSLTGEPDDLKKSLEKDCFLLSSCLITEGEECRALVIGIGMHSQWGKIKAGLSIEAVNTPLQDKLEEMTKQIGYIGMLFSFMTFSAKVISIWARPGSTSIVDGFVNAFIISVTVVVVAIPEGLPLAVTISLAYSTKKMYEDQCFIRVLAACETMGNATNICSDKTGTLTENRMTVVEGWFGDVIYDQEEFVSRPIPESVKRVIIEQVAINRSAYLVYKDQEGRVLDRPNIIGNKTEGALIMMMKSWGADHEEFKTNNYREGIDKTFTFNSAKKRSTAVVHLADGSVRLYCKGASEWILKDCTAYLCNNGNIENMSSSKMANLDNVILNMANKALRTLCLAHKDYPSASALPSNWQTNPPDSSNLVLDCIVGIIDPLRSDVKESVRIAQLAGVTVRMVTGDNIATAKAIARQCGILTAEGTAMEGPTFRNLTLQEADNLLPHLQVLARSSPDDKFLLVTRLNGHGMPANKQEWEDRMKNRATPVSWDRDRDLILPGYKEEWENSRPDGGDVVGVTGDGTNDAPALKAADVGLSMGITGTKVAQAASDIVILDDQFSSIVRAISWGRCVYDNIRKFLQFQLTVNFVALGLVFISAVAGSEEPLNAVQLLWVNLVMDTMGALALGTEGPVPALLLRRPYKRQAPLISWPMWRNILVQSTFQLTLLLLLLFKGAEWFNVHEGTSCSKYDVNSGTQNDFWDPATGARNDTAGTIGCGAYVEFCKRKGYDCLLEHFPMLNMDGVSYTEATLDGLSGWTDTCLTCDPNSITYVHGSIIFNAFIFCQIFNEYTSRDIFDEWNCFRGIATNYVFIGVSIVTLGCQIFLIELGGQFLKTTPLTMSQWLITIALGAIGIPLGMLMRFIPVKEDPNSFFHGAFSSDHNSSPIVPTTQSGYSKVVSVACPPRRGEEQSDKDVEEV